MTFLANTTSELKSQPHKKPGKQHNHLCWHLQYSFICGRLNSALHIVTDIILLVVLSYYIFMECHYNILLQWLQQISVLCSFNCHCETGRNGYCRGKSVENWNRHSYLNYQHHLNTSVWLSRSGLHTKQANTCNFFVIHLHKTLTIHYISHKERSIRKYSNHANLLVRMFVLFFSE